MSTDATEAFVLRGHGAPLHQGRPHAALLAERLSTFGHVIAPSVVHVSAHVAPRSAALDALEPRPSLEGERSDSGGGTGAVAPSIEPPSLRAVRGGAVAHRVPAEAAPRGGVPRVAESFGASSRSAPDEPLSAAPPQPSQRPALPAERLELPARQVDIEASEPSPRDREPARVAVTAPTLPSNPPLDALASLASAGAARPRPAPSFEERARGPTVATTPMEAVSASAQPAAQPGAVREDRSAPRKDRPAETSFMGMPEITRPREREPALPPQTPVVERLSRAIEQAQEPTVHIGSVQVIVRAPAPPGGSAPTAPAANRSAPEPASLPRAEFHSPWLTSRSRYD